MKIWFPASTVVVYTYVMLSDEDLVSCKYCCSVYIYVMLSDEDLVSC